METKKLTSAILIKLVDGSEIKGTEYPNATIANSEGEAWLRDFKNCTDGKTRTFVVRERFEPLNIIDIPQIENQAMFDANRKRSDSKNVDYACPCCGKEIKNPRYFIMSIYGGSCYPSADLDVYADAWVMAVGSECRKRFPAGYVFESK